ncbi:hypothetical protein ACXO1M_05325 [Lactobacillus delbrueckii subsp. bulgaricus]
MTFTFPCGSTTTLDPYSELQTLEKTNSHNYGKYTSVAYNNEFNQARKMPQPDRSTSATC